MCCVLASVAVVGRAWAQPGTVLSYSKINTFDLDAVGDPLVDADEFGDAVANLGDLDGAGPSVVALAVGAVGNDNGGAHFGGVYILFLNGAGDVLSYQKIANGIGGFAAGQLAIEDELGGAIAYLGDLDGAGPSVAAIAVGAVGDDDGGVDAGAVYILFLNSSGQVIAQQKISKQFGNFAGGNLASLDEFGGALIGLGDLDGAGLSAGALAVGVNGDDDGGPQRGATFILLLNTNGTVRSFQKISDTVGNFTQILDDNDNFGEDLANLGDLDGAGPSAATIAITSVGDDDGGRNRGAVFICNLASTGAVLSSQKISSLAGSFNGPLADEDNFGGAITALGDLDGAGPSVAAIAVDANGDDGLGIDRGGVYILLLDSAGSVLSQVTVDSATPGFGTELNDFDEFGAALAALGDIGGPGGAVQTLAAACSMDDDGGVDRGAVYVINLAGAASVGVEDAVDAVRWNGVSHARPNPFRGSTTIPFRIQQAGDVSIDVVDVHGRVVRDLVREDMAPGEHRVVWNGLDKSGRALSPGLYFVRMSVDGALASQTRTVLLK